MKEVSYKTLSVWAKAKDHITRVTWIRDQDFPIISSSYLRGSEELEENLDFLDSFQEPVFAYKRYALWPRMINEVSP